MLLLMPTLGLLAQVQNRYRSDTVGVYVFFVARFYGILSGWGYLLGDIDVVITQPTRPDPKMRHLA
jgi:hypothetical protein